MPPSRPIPASKNLRPNLWQEANNCVDTIGYKEDGKTHYIIKGRVVSSDESGNIYKNLVIQDTYSEAGETPSCITFSINANSLYASYRPGQEVVIDATNMYIGKYSGLQQFGLPEYSSSFGWQTTFMPLEFFKQHAQLNGFPEPEKIDTPVCHQSPRSRPTQPAYANIRASLYVSTALNS